MPNKKTMFLKIGNLSLIINISNIITNINNISAFLCNKGTGFCYSQTRIFVKLFNN